MAFRLDKETEKVMIGSKVIDVPITAIKIKKGDENQKQLHFMYHGNLIWDDLVWDKTNRMYKTVKAKL